MSAIELQQVKKDYRVGFLGRRIRVLDGIDLLVEEGETFGLLGPNGAGKTSTMKLLLGLSRPSGGRVRVLDGSPGRISVRRRMGYLPEVPAIYQNLTGYEYATLAGRLCGLHHDEIDERLAQLTEMVGLEAKALDKPLKAYSKGMLQRLGLIQALIHDPDLILLDEPMSGLDPLGRYEFKQILLQLKNQGKTIFLNSHILADVEAICDRVAILNKGKVVSEGEVGALLGGGQGLFHLELENLNKLGQANVARMALQAAGGQKHFTASFPDLDTALKGLAVARQSGGRLVRLGSRLEGLEEYFVRTIKGGL